MRILCCLLAFVLAILGGLASAAPPSERDPKPPATGKKDHWAFQRLVVPTVPAVKDARVCTPVDAFVLARLHQNELTFAPGAERIALARRLFFDLIGLPPSPEEVDEFLADRSP